MDIDTHVDGTRWWLIVHPGYGEHPFEVDEDAYYAILDAGAPSQCETEVAGSHRGVRCPNYCEPGEYTCPEHPVPSGDPW